MVRSYKDYMLYLFSMQKKDTSILLINFSIFLLSSIPMIKGWTNLQVNFLNNWSIISVFVLSFIQFLWQIYSMTNDFKNYLYIQNLSLKSDNIEFNSLLPSNKEEEKEFINMKVLDNEYVLRSDLIDYYIQSNSIEILRDTKMEDRIKEFKKEHCKNLLIFLRHQFRKSMKGNKYFFNEKKLCLSSDIDIKSNNIYCHKGSYYDTYITNGIAGKYLKTNDKGLIIANAKDYFPKYKDAEGKYRLKDLTSTEMNNEIGISTIGFTSDNYLVIWNQNNRAQSSCELLVPTGSGSCDWTDLVENNFNKTITNAMQRELWEESGRTKLAKTSKEIGDTKILGYFRWVNKAGKPELVGITKLNCRYNDINPEYKEVMRSCDESYESNIYISSIEKIPDIIKNLQSNENISVPLYMCLYCLKRYFDENKEELKKFIFR